MPSWLSSGQRFFFELPEDLISLFVLLAAVLRILPGFSLCAILSD
jgi:hypothetical protein